MLKTGLILASILCTMSAEHLISLILEYRYLILIPLTFIEGPIISFLTGGLSRLGYFDPFFAFWIFIIRDIIVDSALYFLGRWGGNTKIARRLLRKVGVTEEHLKAARLLWERHGFRTMFIGKISYGISQAFILLAGTVHMPFKKFFWYALLVAFVQYGGLFIGGYLLGAAFGDAAGIVSHAVYIVAILALVITGYYVLGQFLRRKLEQEERDVVKE
jgi:membrane protein DedA with SNARE-associated domain